MMAARKNALFNFILRRVLSWTLRRRFHNIYLSGQEHLQGLPPGGPVVGCVNHTNWWDGFVLYVLSHRFLPHEIYLAMEEKNLRRYPFFTWMGVFGVDRTGRGVRYALRLLRDVAKAGHPPLIWMFVPGRLLPPAHPIEVKPGALLLAQHSGATILPLVLRYEWLSESRPSIFVRIAAPLPATTSAAALAATLNQLAADVPTAADAPQFSDYQALYARKMSLNRWWDYLSHILDGDAASFEERNR